MTSNKGLRAAKIADLDAFADGRLGVLPSRLFGALRRDDQRGVHAGGAGRDAAGRRDAVVRDHGRRRPCRSRASAAQPDPAAGRHRRRDDRRPCRARSDRCDHRSSRAAAISKSVTRRSASSTPAPCASSTSWRASTRDWHRRRPATRRVLHESPTGALCLQGDRRQQRRRLERCRRVRGVPCCCRISIRPPGFSRRRARRLRRDAVDGLPAAGQARTQPSTRARTACRGAYARSAAGSRRCARRPKKRPRARIAPRAISSRT